MDGGGPPDSAGTNRPYIITLGNEKGGTGKSTTAAHLAVALLELGFTVGTIDLDGRQGTLSRYLANREAWAARTARTAQTERALPMPLHRRIAALSTAEDAAEPDKGPNAVDRALADMAECNFVVIDTPGSVSPLSRLGHLQADTLITPLNDSFVDLDILAEIDVARREVLAPSVYSKLVWEQNNLRVVEGRPPIDWIVMRNRLTHVDARNKREIAGLLRQLAQRIGFRLTSGFGERVVFRELFDKGLTVTDLAATVQAPLSNPSHRAAMHEIDILLEAVGVIEAAPV